MPYLFLLLELLFWYAYNEKYIDGAPKKVKEAIAKDEAEKIAEQLKKAGAEVEVK